MSQSPAPLEREAELASKAGDAAKLRECLDKGARVGTFVYMYAVASGDVDTFRVIVDHGGDINYCLGGMSGSPLINSLEHTHDALQVFGRSASYQRYYFVLLSGRCPPKHSSPTARSEPLPIHPGVSSKVLMRSACRVASSGVQSEIEAPIRSIAKESRVPGQRGTQAL
jgi:hypothetical protein